MKSLIADPNRIAIWENKQAHTCIKLASMWLKSTYKNPQIFSNISPVPVFEAPLELKKLEYDFVIYNGHNRHDESKLNKLYLPIDILETDEDIESLIKNDESIKGNLNGISFDTFASLKFHKEYIHKKALKKHEHELKIGRQDATFLDSNLHLIERSNIKYKGNYYYPAGFTSCSYELKQMAKLLPNKI
ncbi:hypothetical protein K9L67_00285 [Candidatus Woesearchaeota archaeon]|nr:hypothetical protein [Candidatus Woesearchaeota archaeon]MCF7900644.1 hypothetical protein [Candidatus Woesearchaeota archaeon]MCF8013484.1 hypothetical protein [Candidatus Woesearchaeota archaeon]